MRAFARRGKFAKGLLAARMKKMMAQRSGSSAKPLGAPQLLRRHLVEDQQQLQLLERLITLTKEQRSLLTYLAKDAVVDGKIAGGLWQSCELALDRS